MKKIILLLSLMLSIRVMAYQSLTVVVNAAPGGLQDQAVRAIQAELFAELGYPIIIEYRPGANGKLAILETVNQTKNNQMAIMITTISFLITEEHDEIAPISFYGTTPFFLVTKNNTTWSDILTHCISGKKINYGTTGTNSPGHIFISILDKTCANPMQHIPYKGINPAIADLLGGQIDLVASSMLPIKEHVLLGKLKLLGTIGPIKSVQFENLPGINGILYKDIDPDEMYFFSTVSADKTEIKRITQALDKIYITKKFKNFIKSNEIVRPDVNSIAEHYRVNWSKLHQIIANN